MIYVSYNNNNYSIQSFYYDFIFQHLTTMKNIFFAIKKRIRLFKGKKKDVYHANNCKFTNYL